MTQEMYGAQGRVGNKTYYRAPSGATVARTVVTPKNPKTQAQTYQRVIAKQVSACYAKMKEICDHSFEGVTMGAECMNRFRKLNLVTLRSRAAEIQNAGISLADFYQFQPIGSEKFVPAAVIISEGSLPKVKAGIDNQTSKMTLVVNNANTYRAIIEEWGLRRGDQLTFVAVTKDSDGDYNFKYSRVILDPRNADGSGASLDSPFVTNDNVVNLPNPRNKGNLTVDFSGSKLYIGLDEDPMAAAGIIVSRKSGDYQFRSNCKLVLDETVIGTDLCGLETAVQRSYETSEIYVENDAYLNNSGVGGSEGTSSGATSGSDDPTFSTNAIINGVSQNVSGTTSTSSLTSLVVKGTNLTEENVYAMVGSERKTATINAAKTQATFTWSSSPAVGSTVAVHTVNAAGTDSVLFNVAIINSSSGGGNGEGLGD